MCSTSSGTATGTVLLENARMRVTEWRFAARGDNTGWHRHAYDYLVIPLFDGVLDIDLPDGTRVQANLKNGIPYDRQAGVEHDVISANDFECAFIEVELLEPAQTL
ncbi:cupin domain-containing protein [Aliiroseovarius sp. Z3]|uniref:cupin domain-containing protein n=1 Tax=Aliiroseovarius sp. Z3 TaxID=2811402 RepID=UPI0023B2096E|nr:cupin domain-containing protein [Aliiroseovarius sp. Z3]MDE9449500.1 cupin domain-containing protein [Aliiroseovarius sp. Z3]